MTDASARARRWPVLPILWAGALGAALVAGPLVSTTSGADPTPTPNPIVIAYSRSLLRAGDFARQYTRYQCVGASLQTMRNIISTVNNRGPNLQRKLWRLARAHSLYKADGGADPFGWTTATTLSSIYGRYVLVAADTMTGAVKAAARGIATTGRPAGFIVWGGRHAWVISGFEATADPNDTDEYRVVTIRMADPLWPYLHARGRIVYRPGQRLYMSALRRSFTAYHDSRRDPQIEGLFVAIVPLADGDPVPDGAWVPNGPTPPPAPPPDPTPTATPSESPSSAP
jgi:hypothetical protein